MSDLRERLTGVIESAVEVDCTPDEAVDAALAVFADWLRERAEAAWFAAGAKDALRDAANEIGGHP